ncbi:Chemotaxis response regulator protein-glutamate methylesterase CheB [hydrothermal vent metagenome]|uniref:protein-glutamate methylesterase n=1 Tax=hydrothermal vent metagenome TaxID=652676 RepID=A0A3B1D9E5_9ZZZZ
MPKKIKVLVVDDSAFSRQTIKNMLLKAPAVDVVGIAVDGIDAIEKTLRYRPDLITLDLEMPEMDGFSFLRWLMRERPAPVIMVSSYSDSKTVFKALELGAVDFIAKPTRRASFELQNIENDLLKKVRNIDASSLSKLSRNLQSLPAKRPFKKVPAFSGKIPDRIVAIGASTGGPQALQLILTGMPGNFPAPIVISQHMPGGFTASFAERLDRLSAIRVKEAENDEPLEPGKALICPGGYHLMLKAGSERIYTRLKNAEGNDKYVPSINLMMQSVAEIFKDMTLGVVLTGMGNDGTMGMVEIFRRGGYTITESEETAVVFGMPHEVIKAGAAGKVLPLRDVPSELIKIVMKER